MRLKEDNSSWKSRGIKRRDFRHTKGDPEEIKGHSKRRTKAAKKPDCHHEWIEVTYEEYLDGKDAGEYYWWDLDDRLAYKEKVLSYTTFYLCGYCLERETKIDKGKYRKAWARPFKKHK